MSKLTISCRNCGSDRVVRNAWACWSYERQEWKLGNMFDYAFCITCEIECTIQETAEETIPQHSSSPRPTENIKL